MSDRPGSVAMILLTVSEWMNVADEAFETLAQARGEDHPARGHEVQDDLAALAGWFQEHPDDGQFIFEKVFQQ